MSDVKVPLSPEERERLIDLRARGDLSKKEQSELADLESRDVFPEHDPAEPAAVLPQDDAARLRELRAKDAPTDAEKEEMARLGAAESEAAGHVVRDPPTADVEPTLLFHTDTLALVEDIIRSLPQLYSLLPTVARIRGDLQNLIHLAG